MKMWHRKCGGACYKYLMSKEIICYVCGKRWDGEWFRKNYHTKEHAEEFAASESAAYAAETSYSLVYCIGGPNTFIASFPSDRASSTAKARIL